LIIVTLHIDDMHPVELAERVPRIEKRHTHHPSAYDNKEHEELSATTTRLSSNGSSSGKGTIICSSR